MKIKRNERDQRQKDDNLIHIYITSFNSNTIVLHQRSKHQQNEIKVTKDTNKTVKKDWNFHFYSFDHLIKTHT